MDFQSEVVALSLAFLFLTDPEFCEKVSPFKDYILSALPSHIRWIAEVSLGHYEKYRSVIGVAFLLEELKKVKARKELPTQTIEQVIKALDEIEVLVNKNVIPSTQYAIDEVLAYAKTQALRSVVIDNARLLEAGKVDEFVNKIQRTIEKFNVANLSEGARLSNIDARTIERKEGKQPVRVPTGIPDVDALIGGLGDGELGVVIGPSGGGKTSFLIHLSCFAMIYGRNVVYITLEMSPRQLLDKVDSFIADVPLSKLPKDYETVRKRVKKFVNLVKAGLDVKQFPSGLTRVEDIDAYLKFLNSTGFKPGMLMVDYGELLAVRSDESMYEGQGENFTKLRGIAVKWQIPVWVASQSNRPAWSKRIIKPDDIAESFKKVHVADAVIGICRTEQEKRSKQVRFYIGKCRFEVDGFEVGPYDSALDRGRIVDFGDIFSKFKKPKAPAVPEIDTDTPFGEGVDDEVE